MTRLWRNKERVRSQLKTSRPLSLAEHQDWYRAYAERGDDFLFVILERRRGDRPVGQVSLYAIDESRGMAEFGRLVIGEEDALGHGYGREASERVVGYAFNSLGLAELWLEVYPENSRALAIYHRLGFSLCNHHDGLLRMRLRRSEFKSSPTPQLNTKSEDAMPASP
jgi:RimJ/RimL family protein N-acetyltransferase